MSLPLTATAPRPTLAAIRSSLHMTDPVVLSYPLDRRNIFLLRRRYTTLQAIIAPEFSHR